MKTQQEKRKGRANSALRIGLRAAEQRFKEIGDKDAAADVQRALDRATRMEER